RSTQCYSSDVHRRAGKLNLLWKEQLNEDRNRVPLRPLQHPDEPCQRCERTYVSLRDRVDESVASDWESALRAKTRVFAPNPQNHQSSAPVSSRRYASP